MRSLKREKKQYIYRSEEELTFAWPGNGRNGYSETLGMGWGGGFVDRTQKGKTVGPRLILSV
jgi:hypothetical protein